MGLRVAMAAAAAMAFAACGIPDDRAGDPGAGSPTTPPSEAVDLPAGWHWESWRDVAFAVPDAWTYGHLHQTGCDPGNTPAVERPGGASTLMWCPRIGWGAALSEDGQPYGDVVPFDEGTIDVQTFPEGAAVTRTSLGDVHLLVIAPDARTAEAVIRSAHLVDGVDPNGCPVSAPFHALGAAPVQGSAVERLMAAETVSVCRYDVVGGTAALAQSERLDRTGTDRWVEALLSAPPGTGPDASPDDCLDSPETEVVGVSADGGSPVAWVHFAGCRGHGVDLLDGRTRQLTADVLHWAISPGWSGGLPGEVPVPDGFPRDR